MGSGTKTNEVASCDSPQPSFLTLCVGRAESGQRQEEVPPSGRIKVGLSSLRLRYLTVVMCAKTMVSTVSAFSGEQTPTIPSDVERRPVTITARTGFVAHRT